MKKHLSIFIVLCICIIRMSLGLDTITTDQIANLSSSAIHDKITYFQATTFSPSSFKTFTLSGWNSWESLLVAIGEYFKNPKNLDDKYRKNIKNYQNNLATIVSINYWLHSTLKNIQSGAITANKYQHVQDEIEKKMDTLNQIYADALNKILEDTAKGAYVKKWETAVSDKKITTIFPQVNTFLTDYQRAKSLDLEIIKGFGKTMKGITIDDPQLYYENRQSTINKYIVKNRYQISELLEKLAQIIYLEEQKWWPGVNVAEVKKAFNDIKAQFPYQTYAYSNAKINDSQDKPSRIILDLADTTHQALEILYKNI